MSFGSTSGRGFENEFAPFLWGGIVVVTLLLWVVFHLQHRKWNKDDDDESGRDA